MGGGIGGSDEEGELSGHGSLVRDLSSCRSGGIFRPVLLVRLLPASFLHLVPRCSFIFIGFFQKTFSGPEGFPFTFYRLLLCICLFLLLSAGSLLKVDISSRLSRSERRQIWPSALGPAGFSAKKLRYSDPDA